MTQEKVGISIIVPVSNEAEVLPEFHSRIMPVLESLEESFELLFVDDGSRDGSVEIVSEFADTDHRIGLLALSRNFGKEIAMTAGMDHVSGDAVVIIDADLQDPPELIPELVNNWRAGYDNVFAQRSAREGESALKRGSAHLFYRMINRLSEVPIPKDTGDYRLLSRRAVEDLNQLREQHRFMKGLFAWVGHRQKAVHYRREPRYAGQSKWDYWRLWNFALEGITSFSTAPLKLATYLGITTAFGAFCYAVIIIQKTLRYGNPVDGWSSLMVVMLFLGGVQLLTLGIVGEYVGRTFDETKNRPLYIVGRHLPTRRERG